MDTVKLTVTNLPFSATEESLLTLFAEFGPLTAKVAKDRGFGFLVLPEETAFEAVEALDASEYLGRTIRVKAETKAA